MDGSLGIVYAVAALGLLAGGVGFGLFWASRKFAVEENPVIVLLEGALPGVNCGGCGQASCRAFAEFRAEHPESGVQCPVGGETVAREVARILKVEMQTTAPQVARLKCSGTHAVSAMGGLYDGIEDCRAATLLSEGCFKLCPYGCLGLGTCIRACKFGAIRKKDGIVEIDEQKCTGCGMCIGVCPQHVLELMPKGDKVYVGCSSNDRGGQVRTACLVGCIGCRKCEKVCEFDAVHVTDFCSKVDPTKCTLCGKCVEACPSQVIYRISSLGKPVAVQIAKPVEATGA